MSDLQNYFRSSEPIFEKREVWTQTDPATGVVIFEQWLKDGKPHRTDGPAVIRRDPETGVVTGESWWKDGKLCRADGPAIIRRDPETGVVTGESWWKDGWKDGNPQATTTPRPPQP